MGINRPIRAVHALLVSLTTASVLAQKNGTPRFEDYPVFDVFSGTPAAPILSTPEEKRYRTMIREGVSKGWGVFRDGKEQAGPNFAGHFIAIVWGVGPK